MNLPQSSGSATQWALLEFRQKRASSTPAADGTCQLDFGQVEPDELWLVQRVVVSNTSSTPTICYLYETEVSDGRVLDGTRVGNFNVADNNSPIQVQGGETLVVRWLGASAGAVGTARVQLMVLKREAR